MQLKMILEIEVSMTEDVSTEQAKTIMLSFFRDIRSDAVGGEFDGATIDRVTLLEMRKNDFEI